MFTNRLARAILSKPPCFRLSTKSIISTAPLPRLRAFSYRAPLASDDISSTINKFKISTFTDNEYNKVSNETMETMSEYFEELVESFETPVLDLEFSAGVLTFQIGEKGTYVINKQPPNHQIWLSSPISGPKRFDFDSDNKVWFYNRDGTQLSDLLNVELRDMLETENVNLDLKLED